MTALDTVKEADRRVEWLRQMLIRLFEDKVQELYQQGLVAGTTHLCQGQEPVCVGAPSAMARQDTLTVTYRGHGQALARAVDVYRASAELMGRSTVSVEALAARCTSAVTKGVSE